MHIERLLALSVDVIDSGDSLLRVRVTTHQVRHHDCLLLTAAVGQMFPCFSTKPTLLSSSDAVGQHRAEQAHTAFMLYCAAFALSVLLPTVLRPLGILESPARNADVVGSYQCVLIHLKWKTLGIRHVAAPLGVLVGALSPLALDQLMEHFVLF